jgi:predicted enzyme related to lactoylglutathione lyase
MAYIVAAHTPVATFTAMPKASALATITADWWPLPSHNGTADTAVRLGASIVKGPSDMQGAGRYAVLEDPQGAVFAIIDPENARPENIGVPPLGTFSWHELATSDNEAGFAFYSQLFGWDVITRMDMGPIGTYLIFGWKGQQRGGMYISPPSMPMPPNWMPYVSLASADESFAVATSSGATGMQPPMEVPGGSRVAIIADPTGAAFAIHSMAAPAAAQTPASPPEAPAKPRTSASKSKPKVRPKAKSRAKPKKAAAPRKKVARKVAAKKKRPAQRSRGKTANKARVGKSKTKLKTKSSRRKK